MVRNSLVALNKDALMKPILATLAFCVVLLSAPIETLAEFKAGGNFYYDKALSEVSIEEAIRFVITRWSEWDQ